MQTSAPGNCSRLHRFRRGFTLVELLVVLLIVGILGIAVLPTLTFRQASSKDEAERLARLIEHAEVMATSLGSPIGLDIADGQYQFLRWTGTWSAMDSQQLFRRYQLPAGIAIEAQADPASGQAAPRLIRFPPVGYPPAFAVRVSGSGHAWLIKGNLAGRVSIEGQESPP